MKTKVKRISLALFMLVGLLVQLIPFQSITAQAKTLDPSVYGSGAGTPGPTALKQKRALSEDVATFFGISTNAIVKELEKHEHDGYYIGTPYRGLYTDPDETKYLSPNENPNSHGPGMNCTGFVAYVIKQAGGDISRITNNSTGFGGVANAYNWRDVLRATTRADTYNSISEMLNDGKMRKGDIIYFDPDKSIANYDCHIGFFWGDSPSDNKFWHSYPEANQISEIKEKTKAEKIYVFHNGVDTSDIEISKVDKDTGAYIPDTGFKATFDGENAPAGKNVKTGSNGKVTIKGVPVGVKYKITETSVPKPYVLASSVGESDSFEGIVKPGETASVIAKNVKATGQIVIEKSGVESGKEPWNDNYSRAGNVFEIREKDKDGKVVETITSNDKGVATSSNKLPLGSYYVSEKTAANGFANTFKPVTVKLEYQNQKTSVVTVNDKGTNQEVTGSSVLTKEDEESKNETQGRATFEGAEYGLFYKDGTPVKWTDKVKPDLTNGTKVETEDDSVVIRIDDKDQTAGVKHLALGSYFWKETKNPEGYQIDQNKREFTLTYKDQDTKVVAADVTSQEKVIKFTIDGFKYLQSKAGNINSGYNGIKFALTPTDPTKGEVVETETVTDANGYDGYWKFEFPYGDYKISEVEAPSGYKKIKDLIVKSSFDKEKREYNVTITEEGQTEPIKTLTVAESKINEGSNHASLGKLMITNNLVKAPEISTQATVNGKDTFTPGKDTPMKDVAKLTGLEVGQKYRLKDITLWRIQNGDIKNATPVYQADEDFVAEEETMEKVIETLVDTSNDDENTSYVWTEKLAELDESDKGKEVADHEDLENKEQTVKPEIPEEEEPEIETLFVTADGKKEIDATKNQKLIDKVSQDFPESQVGLEKFWVHKLHKVSDSKTAATTSSSTSTTTSSSGTKDSSTTSSSKATTESSTTKDTKSEVLETVNDKRKVTKGKEEFDVDFEYNAKKHNLKKGEKLVVTHEVYNDEKHEDKYVDHFNLNNEKQTIRPKEVESEKEKEKTETPVATKTTTEKSIPQTGSYNAFQEFLSIFK